MISIATQVCVLLAAASIGCRPAEPVTPSSPAAQTPLPGAGPSQAVAEGSADAAAPIGAASALPAEWRSADEAWLEWTRSGEGQAGWAALLEAAVASADPVRAARALDALGRRLSVWRGAGLAPELVTAVQRFGSAEAQATRLAIDARRIVPALEVLIDVGDAAALVRVTRERSGRAAGAAWASARAVGQDREQHGGSVQFAGGCALAWNGHNRGEAPTTFRETMGSHSAGCAGGHRTIIPVHADRVVRLEVVDGGLVWHLEDSR